MSILHTSSCPVFLNVCVCVAIFLATAIVLGLPCGCLSEVDLRNATKADTLC